MKKWMLLAMALAMQSCAHEHDFEVKNPGQKTEFETSAGYWENSGRIRTKKELSDWQACMAEYEGMDEGRAGLLCDQRMLAGEPDLRRQEYGYWR
jgi:hypothetical protein